MAKEKCPVLEVTHAFQQDYRHEWSKMPFGGGLHLNYTINEKAVILNLKNLRTRLEDLAEDNKKRDAELDRLRKLVSGLGSLIRLASDMSDPNQTGGPR